MTSKCNNAKEIAWKVFTAVGIITFFTDIISDILMLAVYKVEQSTTVFVLAVSFIVIPNIIACILTFLMLENKKYTILQFPLHLVTIYAETKALLGEDDDYKKDFRDAMLLIEAVLEAVPELVLNLYVLSFCGQTIRAVQYFSAAASLLTICVAVTKMWDEENFSWIFAITFFYKSFMITARILALMYFIFYLEYWAILFVALHFSLFLFINWKIVKNGKHKTFKDRLKNIFVRAPLDAFVSTGINDDLIVPSKYVDFEFIQNCLHVFENVLLVLIPSLVYGISQNCSQGDVTPLPTANTTIIPDLSTDSATKAGDMETCRFCLMDPFIPIVAGIQAAGILCYVAHAAGWHHKNDSDSMQEEENNVTIVDHDLASVRTPSYHSTVLDDEMKMKGEKDENDKEKSDDVAEKEVCQDIVTEGT